MNKFSDFLNFIQDRDLCAIYTLKKGIPQEIKLYETIIYNNRLKFIPTPVSTYAFFQTQWRQKDISQHLLLLQLHQHKELYSNKQLIVDPNHLQSYIYIPSLKRYLE